jgi:hypothetical protein
MRGAIGLTRVGAITLTLVGAIALTAAAAQVPTPRATAPVDFTGYWVSIVSEDWRWRMITPPKGDYANIPVNADARKAGEEWNPAKDAAAGEQCKGYAAPAIMREPGRLHITWTDDSTLMIETDAGMQTRLFHFGGAAAPQGAKPSWQGYSTARWEAPPRPAAGGGLPLGLRAARRHPKPHARSHDDSDSAGIPAQERDSVQRRRAHDRVLRHVQGAGRPRVVRRDDHRDRPAIPEYALDYDEPFQEGSRRIEMESNAVRGEVTQP